MANIYDMADTWNNAATTFTALKMNVTDTASASGSLLMGLQVGGTNKFEVGKDGAVHVNAAMSFSALPISAINWFMVYNGYKGGGFAFAVSTTSRVSIGGGTIEWGGYAGTPTPNLILARDTDHTLAQRNGTNAQTFNIYNTYTSGSVYERGFLKWNSNVFEIGTEHSGATLRGLRIGASGNSIGFMGATPVAQQATTGTTTGFTAGAGTAVLSDSTFTGNSGTAAYTIGDIVLALKNYGLLAAS